MEVVALVGFTLFVGPVVALAEIVLAMRRSTRYFAIPLVAGAVMGLVAFALAPQAGVLAFLAGFTCLALPIGVICAIIGVFSSVDKASQEPRPGGTVNGDAAREGTPLLLKILLGGAAIIAAGMAASALNGPVGTPTRLTANVHNHSSWYLGDGETKLYLDAELGDGRRVTATGCGPVSAYIHGQMAIEEYRRRLYGRPVYLIPGMSCEGQE